MENTTAVATSSAGSRSRAPVVVGAVVVGCGAAVAVIRFLGRDPSETGPEALLASFAVGAVIAVPGALALLSSRGRRALLLPSAIGLLLVSMISFATLPLVVGSVFLVLAYAKAGPGERLDGPRLAATTVVVLLLLVAAAMALLVHQDPRTWTSATEQGGTSDIVTVTEALISLALSAAAVGAGWVLARPASS